ncbi:hypothetical protein NKR19_g2625 [Coniochaeta hoffmannii]|uniref:Secreted protein n=1 Tax=Coniochaeta hoffmannii TaxID=91930 RepID=A0AA38RW16_9PEZI|nr:hypothetical protein NKR19_g2625 [Coniochaeta hoffmannii]
MKLLTSLLFLPALILCAPAGESPRSGQTAPVQFISASASGSGCPQGVSTIIDDPGTTLTLGFDQYQTQVEPGVPGSEREKNCDIFLTLRYPLGCTSTTMSATYHGFAQLQSGVGGAFPASYVLSPGAVTSSQPPTTKFDATEFGTPGGVYTRNDAVTAKEDIRNANQQVVSLAVRTRVILQPINQTVAGTLTLDDASFQITEQQHC